MWAPVHGSRAALQDLDEPYDASWARNKALVLEAGRLGYDSVLVAQHTINLPDPAFGQLEAWTVSAALAALTSRIVKEQQDIVDTFHMQGLVKQGVDVSNFVYPKALV